MTISANFIIEYEKKATGHIEQTLNNAKVKLWADAFNTSGSVKTKLNVFFGHQRTDRESITVVDNSSVYLKTYTFEIMVEVFTLKNHQDALFLIETILDDVLKDFKPYKEFSPFVPTVSGSATRNLNNNSWLYNGEGITSISSDVSSLTLYDPDDEYLNGKLINIGLFSYNGNQIGRFDNAS